MLKYFFAFLLLIFIKTSCAEQGAPAPNSSESAYTRYTAAFIDVFDTVTSLIGYAESQEEFDYFSQEVIHKELRRLHDLFDGFSHVDGVNNIYTINQNAGLRPVQAEPVLLELIKLSKEAHLISDGTVNIALGPVISIWREYAAARGERGIPDYSDLQAVRHLTDISDIIINEEEGSVFLRYEGMALDVGSIAKGFAVEIAAQKAIEAGFASFSLSVGGDIRVAAGPLGGVRDFWSIGVENPEAGGNLDAVFVTDKAIFTSGDYHRYFMVEGERFHHIIDPGSLMPANKYRSVTVVHPNGGIADILTTAAFLLDIDRGTELLEEFGAKGLWVLHDGEIVRTEGFYLINRGS